MFFIPGWLISLVTFPGVVVHEAAHRFFCDVTDTPVYEVSYFRARGKPAGYVIHGRPSSLGSALLISGGPLLINSVLCAVLTLAVAYEHFVLNAGVHGPVLLLLTWLGYSIGIHAIPSRQDAASFTAQVKQAHGQGITLLLAKSLSGLITLAGPLRIFYAIGISLAIPALLGAF